MLKENLKNLRKAKGYSQEDLALKLNVVRQTVSKWEKGLSVPDAEMLIQLAENLDTSVQALLGETATPTESHEKIEIDAIAAKLALLNEQFAKHNENRRKIWRMVFLLMGICAVLILAFYLVPVLHLLMANNSLQENVSIIGGADGPTAILVSSGLSIFPIFFILLLAVIAFVGICKTKKR